MASKKQIAWEADRDAVEHFAQIKNHDESVRSLFDEQGNPELDAIDAIVQDYLDVRKIRSKYYAIAFRESLTSLARTAYIALPDVASSLALRHLKARLEYELRVIDDTMEKFRQLFERDPFEALSWSMDAFEKAAMRRVISEILTMIENDEQASKKIGHNEARGDVIESIKTYARNRAVRMARYPTHSTSPASNLAQQYLAVAWATFAELSF